MMDKKQRRKMLWRIPLIVAIAVAMFWEIWYLIAGEVPTVKAVKMLDSWSIDLPFSVSRWTDVPIALVWAFILVFIFTRGNGRQEKTSDNSLDNSLISAIAAPATIFLILHITVSPVFSLAVGILVIVVISLDIDNINFGLVFVLGTILVAFGLIWGLFLSLILALILIVLLVFGLKPFLKFLLSKNFKNWLLGK